MFMCWVELEKIPFIKVVLYGTRVLYRIHSNQLTDYHLVQIRTTSPIRDPTTQHNGFLAPHAQAQCERLMFTTILCKSAILADQQFYAQ